MANFRSGALNQGAPLGLVVQSTTLSADDQAVDVTGVSWLQVTSNNATATNRTFTIVPSVLVGHELTVQLLGATNLCELAASSTMRIQSTWSPARYDIIKLVSDGTAWNEVARSGASGTATSVVKFSGKYTTLGGNATEAQTVTGVLSTDVVVATLQAKGGTPRTLLTTAPTADTITYVFSGDPSTDHVVSYVVFRAV